MENEIKLKTPIWQNTKRFKDPNEKEKWQILEKNLKGKGDRGHQYLKFLNIKKNPNKVKIETVITHVNKHKEYYLEYIKSPFY